MKLYTRGLHACLHRRFDVRKYENYALDCGHEIVSEPEHADLILIWTCGFRQDFFDRSLRTANSYVENFGHDKVLVCGCIPGIDETGMRQQYSGRFFKWREEAEALETVFGKAKERRNVAEANITLDIHAYRRDHPDKHVSHHDQFIKLHISEGCPYHCLYCSEKLTFPPYRSFPLRQIVDECRQLVATCNTKKVSLIGDTVAYYGKEIGTSIEELVREILAIDDEVTVGLVNIHPKDYWEHRAFFRELIATDRLFLLGLPIQSACDRVLASMGRRYTHAQIETIFTEIKGRGFGELETHAIAGYPSETREEFMQTVEFLATHRPKHVLASGYMDNRYMKSFELDGKVAPQEIRARLRLLADEMKRCNVICNYDDSEVFESTAAPLEVEAPGAVVSSR